MAELSPEDVAPFILRRPADDALAWVCNAIGRGARVALLRRLRGGVSGATHRIDLVDAGGRRHSVVLRRFLRPDWGYPGLAEREAAALEVLAGTGVPAPELMASDPSGAHCGAPAVLMTLMPGRPELRPNDMDGWLAQLAGNLPPVHSVEPGGARIRRYRPYHDLRSLDVPAWTNERRAWRAVIGLLSCPRPRVPQRFIHRDYHPANVLWQRGRLTAIVDWVNASIGPAQIDVGYCRQNLARSYGVAIADRFLELYQTLQGRRVSDYDPYWDAITASDLLPDVTMLPAWARLHGDSDRKQDVHRRLDRYAVSIAARC